MIGRCGDEKRRTEKTKSSETFELYFLAAFLAAAFFPVAAALAVEEEKSR